MTSYFIYIVVTIILLFVIVIASKAVRRGINAKLENNLNFEENQNNQILQNDQMNTNISNELSKIKSLYEEGALTEEEYKKAKTKILD